MKRLVLIGALLAVSAAAQERVLGFTAGTVRVRTPGETTWREMPASALPPNASIRARSQDNWVEILDAGGQPLQVRWNFVRQGGQAAPCPPASRPTNSAGSQALGAQGC